jgi:hypothetical protein
VEGLDVAALVDHLGAAVELGVEPRHRLGDLRGGEERPLLAVEELAQHPRHQRAALGALLARGEALERRVIDQRDQ